MITLLKFVRNKDKNNHNSVISRTMLKVAVINRHHTKSGGEMPKAGEIWKCQIITEKNSGERKGCFIVNPLSKINEDSMKYIIPGMYEEKEVNGKILIFPKKTSDNNNWLMSLMLKKVLAEGRSNIYSIIVVLDGYDPSCL